MTKHVSKEDIDIGIEADVCIVTDIDNGMNIDIDTLTCVYTYIYIYHSRLVDTCVPTVHYCLDLLGM